MAEKVPTAQRLAEALARLRSSIEATPVRREALGGQWFDYVKQDDMIALVDAAIAATQGGQQAARSEAPAGWLRDQRGEYEGPATLDPLFVLAGPYPSMHGATYSPLYAASPHPEAQPAEKRKPLTEAQLVRCLNYSGCIGKVTMSFESGPYDITRPSINATRLCGAIERAHGIKEG